MATLLAVGKWEFGFASRAPISVFGDIVPNKYSNSVPSIKESFHVKDYRWRGSTGRANLSRPYNF